MKMIQLVRTELELRPRFYSLGKGVMKKQTGFVRMTVRN